MISRRCVPVIAAIVLSMAFLISGCNSGIVVEDDVGPQPDGAEDAQIPEDASADGPGDAAVDAGDTGIDAGVDAGVDAGWDAGFDAGKPGLIIPGKGIEIYVKDADVKATAFNVMTDTYGSIVGKLGNPTKPFADVEWYRRWASRSIDALFVNTAGKSAIDNADLLNEFILTKGFNGYTETGHGIGTPRTAWKTEMGNPDNTTVYQGYTTDMFFLKGFAIVYDSDNEAAQLTVYRKQKDTPHYPIDWELFKIKDIIASLTGGSGSKFGAVSTDFGPEDLKSVTTDTVEIDSLTYIALGLTFTGTVPWLGSEFQVNTIAIIPPYYGVIKGSTLQLGALHADVKTFMEAQNKCCGDTDCTTKGACVEYNTTITQDTKTVNLYYYRIKLESAGGTKYYMTVGFIYNGDNMLTTVLLGYPIAK